MHFDGEQKLIMALFGAAAIVGVSSAVANSRTQDEAAIAYPSKNPPTDIRTAYKHRDAFNKQIRTLARDGKINEIKSLTDSEANDNSWPIIEKESQVLASRATITSAQESTSISGAVVTAVLSFFGIGALIKRRDRIEEKKYWNGYRQKLAARN